LTEVFGYSEFRAGQRTAVDALVAGDDAVVLMPTGGGTTKCLRWCEMIKAKASVWSSRHSLPSCKTK
jgi:ATP-dependent DNA helicase RecQ